MPWEEGELMNLTFSNHDKALLTVMLQCETPDTVIQRVRNAIPHGAEAFGLQVETLLKEYQDQETYKRLFGEMSGLPVYVTNYRNKSNEGKTDEELAEGLVTLAESGATLCDVMGDMFCRHPEELTDNQEAIEKQMKLIDTLHSKGAEVLMSSHVLKYTPAERVLEIAIEQKRRGADVIKIVTGAENMEQQLENLKTTELLKKELGKPFLYLSGGDCTLHRRLGWKLGCSMILCVYEHDALSTVNQPLLHIAREVRDNMGF